MQQGIFLVLAICLAKESVCFAKPLMRCRCKLKNDRKFSKMENFYFSTFVKVFSHYKGKALKMWQFASF